MGGEKAVNANAAIRVRWLASRLSYFRWHVCGFAVGVKLQPGADTTQNFFVIREQPQNSFDDELRERA